MKLTESRMREIFEAQRYAVNPEHEASFRAMLVRDKNRRRMLLFLFVLAGIAITTLVLTKFLGHGLPEVSTPGQSLRVESTPALAAQSIASAKPDVTGITDANARQSGNSLQPEETILPVTRRTRQSGTPVQQQVAEQHVASQHDLVESLSGIENTAPEQPHIGTALRSDLPQSPKESETAPASVIEEKSLDANAVAVSRETDDHRSVEKPMNTSASEAQVQPAEEAASDASENQSNSESTIIPASRQVMQKPFGYGITTTWSPSGLSLDHSGLEAGNAFQLGGYVSYRLSPKTIVRGDAGIGMTDGGFTFVKQSESELFGFSLVKQRHRLTAGRLYSGYLSTEVGWVLGDLTLLGGIRTQYMYGAKGNVLHEELLVDAPSPTATLQKNVWLSTSDLHQMSWSAVVGLRSRITHRLDLAGMVRLPLTRTVRLKYHPEGYQFEIASPGVSPVLALSFRLNQQ